MGGRVAGHGNLIWKLFLGWGKGDLAWLRDRLIADGVPFLPASVKMTRSPERMRPSSVQRAFLYAFTHLEYNFGWSGVILMSGSVTDSQHTQESHTTPV